MDKFKLGWVVLTPLAIKALHEAEQPAEDFLNRHPAAIGATSATKTARPTTPRSLANVISTIAAGC